jgi:thymidylate synthase
MSGRKDSGFLNYFNRRLPEFAGHESTYYGAYGDRLRNSLGIDQLERAYKALKANPTTRQVVLQIWDAKLDLPSDDGMPRSADVPCNIVSLLKLREGKLEWMQIMRSNDLFRGLPYNIVQFTSLQEVLAGWLEVDVGSYCQISDSLHVYEKDYQAVKKFVPMQASPNTDTLSVPKAESEKLFSELSQRIDLFINENISKPEHLRLSVWAQASPAFQNMLRVVSAEAARRRNWPDEAQSIMDECTNPTFVQSWNRWVNRVAGNISGKTTV